MTNLQINKELIDSMLERLEKDKILEEYYEFVGGNYEQFNGQAEGMSDNNQLIYKAQKVFTNNKRNS